MVVGLGAILHYVHWFSAITSSIILNLAPQKVHFPIQDEHGDAMEDN